MSTSIQVNEQGIELSYLDSGPPDGSTTYRTLIAVHGYGWTCDIFHKALPEARKKGIRMIAVNRRHYPGSTPYAPEELAGLKLDVTDIPKCLLFLQCRGLELISFIHRIAEKLELPTIGPDGSGMITMLGHSIGNIHNLSLAKCFQDVDLPTSLKNVNEWISGIIIFDPPMEACGIRSTEKYISWVEKVMYENLGVTNNLDKAVEAATDWVTGYFQDGYEPALTESAADMEAFIVSHDHSIRAPTVRVIPDAEHFMKIYYQPAYDVELLSVSGLITGAFRVVVLSILDKDKQRTRDEGERAEGSALPHDIKADTVPERNLKLSWLWCENSLWCCTYNAQVHRKRFGFDGSDPNKKMVSIPNANHFFHWEDPERFIDYVLPLM